MKVLHDRPFLWLVHDGFRYSVSVVSSFFVGGIDNIKMVPSRTSKHLIVSRLVAEFGSFCGNILTVYETTFTHPTYGRFLEKNLMKHNYGIHYLIVFIRLFSLS